MPTSPPSAPAAHGAKLNYNGKLLTYEEAATVAQCSVCTLRRRILMGYSIKRAIEDPVRPIASIYSCHGHTMPAADWGDFLSLDANTVRRRLRARQLQHPQWPLDRVLRAGQRYWVSVKNQPTPALYVHANDLAKAAKTDPKTLIAEFERRAAAAPQTTPWATLMAQTVAALQTRPQ